MKCKKHLIDYTSNIGVCATCLRERLFSLIAAQDREDRGGLETQPSPLVFPRSVSPYVCRRNSSIEDDLSGCRRRRQLNHSLSDQRFFSTPQVWSSTIDGDGMRNRKKKSRFSFFTRLFRSKSEKVGMDPPDPRVSVSISGDSSSSPSWFATMLSSNNRKKSRLFSFDESKSQSRGGGSRKTSRYRDRGMSPVSGPDGGEIDELDYGDRSSGYSSESSTHHHHVYKMTPVKAAESVRRGGGGRSSHSRNLSGLTFCLSPLVRASPSRQWNQKEMAHSSTVRDIRLPAKPYLSTAASFCSNRSRKLADFGRLSGHH